jgi:Ca2+-binding EF-hand superfamily protein
VFDIFDYDKSGTIDQKEILQMITATSELLGKSYSKEEVRNFATEIFDACGKKAGQKLTNEEFVRW